MVKKVKNEITLERELKQLKIIAKKHKKDACLQIQDIALSDKRVKEKFLKKVKDGILTHEGHFCPDHIGIPEERWVLFKFRSSGIILLINPSFIGVVNIVTKKVVKIIEPLGWDDKPFS